MPESGIAASVEPALALSFMETTQVLDQSTPAIGSACGYVVAAIAAALVWWQLAPAKTQIITVGAAWRRRFWAAVSLLLFFAACDRLFGLLAFAAEYGRAAFGALDLYENRGPWQIAAMSICALSILAIASLGCLRTRRIAATSRVQWRDAGAAAAMLGLIGWVVCRAISWHDFEVMLTRNIASMQISSLVEWTMIGVLVGFAAWTHRWRTAQRAAEKPVMLASS